VNKFVWLTVCALTAAGLLGWLAWRNWPDESTVRQPPVLESPPAATGKSWFRDMTEQSGVDFTYRNGEEAGHYAILESLGGGVGLIDYDRDGLLDIFLPGGGQFFGPDKKQIKGLPCRLYKNLGGWKFRDVTAEVFEGPIEFYSHGCAVADYDRDGWPDLLVTGYGRLALFHNEDDGHGGRRFREKTGPAGLADAQRWNTSAAWGDLNGDGYPDLYVCQYVNWSFQNHPTCDGYTASVARDICSPRQFDARPHVLYRNNGNGTFTDVSKEAGLRGPRLPADYASLTFIGDDAKNRLRQADHERDFGKGLGVVIVDVNDDRRPDIYVTNDTTEKFLYVNRSSKGQIQLEEVGFRAGVAMDDRGVPNGSMGVDAADYDGSGRPSLLVTNYENELHALYRNNSRDGKLLFSYSTYAAGLASLGRHYVGFGASFFDLDNDGWQDAVIANGHVIRHPVKAGVRQRPVLLRNQGQGADGSRFEAIMDQGGSYFNADHQGRGVAVGDLDNDGRLDLVISHVNEPVVVLRNESGTGNHWLGVELVDKEHRDLVGAKITLDVESRRLTSFAKGGSSYLSSGDRRHLFGLGKVERVGRLTVSWPWGADQHWDNLKIDRYWRLVAGETTPEEARR
jgi:enediyne biosynthesis protein E4